jgi:hypothetical protein
MLRVKRGIGKQALKGRSSKDSDFHDFRERFKAECIEGSAIALSNRIIKATETGDGFRVRINLDIPTCLTRDEVERLIEVTDDWPGWCDSPLHCLSELGLKLEQAIAMVGGAQ